MRWWLSIAYSAICWVMCTDSIRVNKYVSSLNTSGRVGLHGLAANEPKVRTRSHTATREHVAGQTIGNNTGWDNSPLQEQQRNSNGKQYRVEPILPFRNNKGTAQGETILPFRNNNKGTAQGETILPFRNRKGTVTGNNTGLSQLSPSGTTKEQ